MTAKLYHQNGCTQCEAAVLDCRANADGTFDILLDRTAIYPEGGGQLSDTGYIGSARCTHARDDGGEIWHRCDRPLDIGQCVHVAADEAVRLDHTQQHTGEHMLSGLAHSMFGCTNVGFHMANDIVTVDFDKPLSAEQIAELELKINEAIQRDEPTRRIRNHRNPQKGQGLKGRNNRCIRGRRGFLHMLRHALPKRGAGWRIEDIIPHEL